MNFMVDLWWFDSLGYLGYFIQLLTYRYVILVAFSLLFFMVFFLNFWVASRYFRDHPTPTGQAVALSRYRFFVHQFRSGSLLVYAPFSLVLAVTRDIADTQVQRTYFSGRLVHAAGVS